MNRPRKKNKNTLVLEKIGVNVISKHYSQVRQIMSESLGGSTDTILKRALKEGHGIEFSITEDPILYFIVSSQQMELLEGAGTREPNMASLLGNAEIIDTDRERALIRFRDAKDGGFIL